MRQILVIANETVESDVLPRTTRVLIVAPALNSRLRHWVSDEDEARAAADEWLNAIVIATHPPGHSNWLARDLVARARRRFDRPVVHVVVDAVRGREYVREAA
jgi:hypothetical protein